MNSEISEDQDAPVAIGDALQTLEQIMADENSLWTKITQPRLDELLDNTINTWTDCWGRSAPA